MTSIYMYLYIIYIVIYYIIFYVKVVYKYIPYYGILKISAARSRSRSSKSCLA